MAWAEGENIPWNDPDFSRRMLAERLSQEHNLASRRFDIIDRQVAWIHGELLAHAGFRDIRFVPTLVGAEVEEESQSANCAIVGRKAHA